MGLALPHPAALKLSKVAALLASDRDGEVLAAARAGTRLLQAHGLGWSDLIAPCPAPRIEARQGCNHQARAMQVLARGGGRLSQWEAEFCRSLARQWRTPSAKQAAVLDRIERKAGA